MPEFIVRRSRDYWLNVEAKDSDAARDIAEKAPENEWEYTDSDIEVEAYPLVEEMP